MSADLDSGGGEGGGSRRRRAANVHLVPFIDLLSCMIAFLLSTALWTVARTTDPVKISDGGRGAEEVQQPPPS